jgi:hypothetical protein
LNATSAPLNSEAHGSFYVAPIRNDLSENPTGATLLYDPDTHEIKYSRSTGIDVILQEIEDLRALIMQLYAIVNQLTGVA